jgi:RNA polymerase sigma-70 factor (ECF subfamily)
MGDRRAFALIFERHGPAMFRYALPMLDGHVQDAEDALQGAWTKVWLNIGDFRGDSQLRTWLFTVTAREVLNHRRRRRPTPVEDNLLDPQPARIELEPGHQLDERELREALTLALTELPWRQRASWVLREVEGLSYDEIARVLRTTPTVVRGQLHRARATLAVRMEMWR